MISRRRFLPPRRPGPRSPRCHESHGTALATSDMTSTSVPVTANVAGSTRLTLKSDEVSSRVAANAPTAPSAIPEAASSRAPRTISITTVARWAPSAMRTPISGRRRVTVYESTPYSPTEAITSASAANTITSIICVLRSSTSAANTCSIDRTFDTGSSGSTSDTARRTAAASVSGSPVVRTTRFCGQKNVSALLESNSSPVRGGAYRLRVRRE